MSRRVEGDLHHQQVRVSLFLVSIHDVAPGQLAVVQRLRERLGEWGIDRLTLLVVPEHHRRSPLRGSPETVGWLRRRVTMGDEVSLHGWHHLQRRPLPGVVSRLRAAAASAGEAECLGLDPHQRQDMLVQGKRLLEELIGCPVHGFVAPAWLEPPGFTRHLRAAGFRWHESGLWLEYLDPDHRYRAPVLGFATRSRWRKLASLSWVNTLWRSYEMAALLGVELPVRLALHPTDLADVGVMGCAERTVRSLLRRHCVTTYSQAVR